MRVISGKYKGKRVSPPKKFPSRPTTDMAKEGLFNILDNQYYWEDLKILDLFAGTGNISIEFLSRGVGNVLSVDSHPLVIRHLNKLQDEFEEESWYVLRKDAFKFIEENNQRFDIIFADPPFKDDKSTQLPDLILDNNLLTEDGIFVLEHGQENSFESHPRLTDSRNYGGVFFSFFGG